MFGTGRQAITKHLKNIYDIGELERSSTSSILELLQHEGGRMVSIAKHNAQYQPIDVKQFNKVHDRYLCIDNMVYHIGASLKDLGKRWFSFDKMEMTAKELLENVK